jgi:hypothetical protein
MEEQEVEVYNLHFSFYISFIFLYFKREMNANLTLFI